MEKFSDPEQPANGVATSCSLAIAAWLHDEFHFSDIDPEELTASEHLASNSCVCRYSAVLVCDDFIPVNESDIHGANDIHDNSSGIPRSQSVCLDFQQVTWRSHLSNQMFGKSKPYRNLLL